MAIIEGTGEVVIERQPEILEKIIARQRELIDPDFENRHDGIISEYNFINSEMFALANEFIEAVRDCWDIDRAEGFALDNLLAVKRLRRIPATRSFTNRQLFIGNNGVTIPAGRILRNSNNGEEFYTTSSVLLTSRNCISCSAQVGTLEAGQIYSVTVDGYYIEYTSQMGDTAEDIVAGLSDEAFIVLDGTDYFFVFTPVFTIGTQFSDRFIDVLVSSNLSITQVRTEARIESTVFGEIIAPSNSIREFAVPVSGVSETTNIDALQVGRLKETDEEFRIRGKNTNVTGGVGTIPTIENSLLSNVDGVTSALVIENDKGFVDSEGRPPKSYETVVVGGTDLDVVTDIFRTKPSGIETVGNQTEIIQDQNGINRTVKFTRPTPLEVLVNVTYTVYDEETLPITANDSIVNIVVDHINSLGLDKDIIPGRMFGPIYSTVEGIDNLVIEVDAGSGFTTDRIPVGQTEYAATNPNDVDVTEDV